MCKSTFMQLIWTVALSKWLSSRHIFSDDCALGHMWAFSSNPGLCGDGWTPVNTWYSLSRAEGGQGFDKILYHGALHKVSIVINSITMHKNAFLHREPSLISFLLCKKNAIVLDIGSRIARFHCFWCCKFLLQASISSALVLLLPMGILILAALLYYVKLFRHINKKVTRHDTNKIRILKNGGNDPRAISKQFISSIFDGCLVCAQYLSSSYILESLISDLRLKTFSWICCLRSIQDTLEEAMGER